MRENECLKLILLFRSYKILLILSTQFFSLWLDLTGSWSCTYQKLNNAFTVPAIVRNSNCKMACFKGIVSSHLSCICNWKVCIHEMFLWHSFFLIVGVLRKTIVKTLTRLTGSEGSWSVYETSNKFKKYFYDLLRD